MLLEQSGELTVESNLQKKAQQDFTSARVDDEEILSIIRKFHQDLNYLFSDEDNFKLNGGNSDGENSYDYNYSKVNPDQTDEEDRVDFDQIIIFSDKITFDARS